MGGVRVDGRCGCGWVGVDGWVWVEMAACGWRWVGVGEDGWVRMDGDEWVWVGMGEWVKMGECGRNEEELGGCGWCGSG